MLEMQTLRITYRAPRVAAPRRRKGLTCLARAAAPPKKRKTGGGGNGNNDGGGDGGSGGSGWGKPRQSESDDDKKKQINALKRMYYEALEITPSALVLAMKHRWGKPFKCELIVKEQGMAVHVLTEEAASHEDRTEMNLVVEVLNTYGLGPQFLNYIKYSTTIRQPDWQVGGIIIPLNIPTDGPRMGEWNIDL